MYSYNYNMPHHYNNMYRQNIYPNQRFLGGFVLPFALGFATGPLVLGGLGYPPKYYNYPPYYQPYYPPRPY